jgi:hypothetical protein
VLGLADVVVVLAYGKASESPLLVRIPAEPTEGES